MVEGPTDTTTVGLRLPLFLSFSRFLAFPLPHLWKRQQQLWLGFIQLFSLSFHLLLFLCSSHSFSTPNIIIFFYIKQLLSFTYPSLCVYPACLCSKCTYCPCLPLTPASADSRAVSSSATHKDLSAQGKKLLCYQRRRSMHFFFFFSI